MSSGYFPGRGLKKPTNMLQTPQFPNIKKGPPRFVWSKKHWQVDPGMVQKQVEHIPQLQEAAVLYQSYDYGSQHLYGKRPTYTAVVNKEFRPPLVDRDDLLPLSRIPRPTIIPRINPGGAHPSGNNSFADQNINLPDVGKYLTNRVKEGQMRPTFFAPAMGDAPVDNSILPNLETNMPSYSAGAGYKFPSAADTTMLPEGYGDSMVHRYDQFHPEQFSGITPITLNSGEGWGSGRENFTLDYTNPQVSATAGYGGDAARRHNKDGLTMLDSNFELVYNKPQTSATAGNTTMVGSDSNPHTSGWGSRAQTRDNDLYYNLPQRSATAGSTTRGPQTTTPIDYQLETKIAGSRPATAGSKITAIPWSSSDASASRDPYKVYDVKPDVSYVVPANTRYHSTGELFEGSAGQGTFKQKASTIADHSAQSPQIPTTAIPRAGISTPQLKLKGRKDA